jgi:hypothetical protein
MDTLLEHVEYGIRDAIVALDEMEGPMFMESYFCAYHHLKYTF